MHLRVELRNEADELQRIMREVRNFLAQEERLSAVASKVQIALDEMVGNMIRYGEFEPPVDPFPIVVEINIEADYLKLLLIDAATAFNPLQAAKPNTQLSLEERPIGGLGIHLVTQMFDHVEYQRKDNKNQLSLQLALPLTA